MEFADILASSIHDIKNSLSMILNTMDHLLDDPNTHIGDRKQADVLLFETNRANNSLLQLLMLYKMQRQQVSPNIMEHNVDDFLEEVVATNRSLLDSLNIQFDYDCDPSLSGYFDDNLVLGVLNSAILNARRYTKDRISVSAAMQDNLLVLRVEDNGAGFPDFMIADVPQDLDGSASFSSGSTQLGLLFAAQVAHLHVNGNCHGHIALRNRHQLDGGCFEMYLP